MGFGLDVSFSWCVTSSQLLTVSAVVSHNGYRMGVQLMIISITNISIDIVIFCLVKRIWSSLFCSGNVISSVITTKYNALELFRVMPTVVFNIIVLGFVLFF